MTAKDVVKDDEGLLTLRNLARNMVWMMQCFAEGKKQGIPLPAMETDAFTNFIR